MVSLFKDPNGEHVMEKMCYQSDLSDKKTSISVPMSPQTKAPTPDNELESTVAGHEITSPRECKVCYLQ